MKPFVAGLGIWFVVLAFNQMMLGESFALSPPTLDRAIYFDNTGNTEYGVGVAATADEIYVTGATGSAPQMGYLLVYPALLASEGPTWQAFWPGVTNSRGYDYFADIALGPTDLYLVGGGNTLAVDGVGDPERKLLVVKYPRTGPSGEAYGGALWDRSDNIFPYAGGEILSAVVTVETDSGTVLYGAGTFETCGWGANGAAIIGYSGEGGSMVFKEDNFFNSKNDCLRTSGASDLVYLGGELYVAGHTHPAARTDGGNLANRRAALWKVDPSADPLSTDPTLLLEIPSSAFEAAVAGPEHVYAVGYSLEVGGKKDMLVVKSTTNGDNVWTITWGETDIDEVAFGVALSNDCLYMVGETASSEGAGGKDMFLIEISASDGTVLSRDLWGGPFDDLGRDIAAVGANLYVVGDTDTGGATGMDAFLLRYNTLVRSDVDGDGIIDDHDNCLTISNPNQEDFDNDGIGNVCDNCPEVANPEQNDADEDGVGSTCDNCPHTSNDDQSDNDNDNVGDACDSDDDNDGVADLLDNCPSIANPHQGDNDNDGQGDACDFIAVSLTSITLDPEDSTGQTTNAPAAWSTNTADVLSQVGVMSDGVFLNDGAGSGTLREISISLQPGINTFTLYGNGVFPGVLFYGAVLFFDDVRTPPQVAVYNANGSSSSFMVQPAGTQIMGGANGGLFFDRAPGNSVYFGSDGTKVEVLTFTINSITSDEDRISFMEIGPNETLDSRAQLVLRVVPPTTVALTDDDHYDGGPQIDSGRAAWYGSDGHDYEIFLREGPIVRQLTDNDYDDWYCQIDSGQVAWYGSDGHDREIFLWDGASVHQLTDNDYDDYSPQIDNGRVVWYGSDGHDYEIFFWDGGAVQQLTDNDYDDSYPQIHDGQVAWVGGAEIFFWDGGTVQQLTDNDYDDWSPRIDNGRVVWEGRPDGDSEIFFWDGTTVWQLTDNDRDDCAPQIQDAKVVWYGSDGHDREIFFWDGASVRQLTDNNYNDWSPQIDNGQVIWYGSDGNDYEIFYWHGRAVHQLTDNDYNDWSPRIDYGQAVWAGFDGNDSEVSFWGDTLSIE